MFCAKMVGTMLEILKFRAYRHLFIAQIVALLGTGLTTVALGLLAYDLVGGHAAMVLGAVFAIKMVAYVTVAPVATALTQSLPRRHVLVSLDLVRAAVALCLPFVAEVWQVFVLILILQATSAAFTPIFQASIPDVLPDEDRYTRALSLSRLAYDLESLLSPGLAALLLVAFYYDMLFLGTAAGFLASAAFVVSVVLPVPKPSGSRGFYDRTTRGVRIYLKTPRLRGLLAFSMAVSAAVSMVLVNTVVLVKGDLGLGDSAVALAMGTFGTGSMVTALLLPKLLDRMSDRPLMCVGAVMMVLGLISLAVWEWAFGLSQSALLTAWFSIGIGYSAVLTPSGRLLRRSSQPEDRPAVFAAQFALSHACWLLTYPLAGVVMTLGGNVMALCLLSGLSGGALLLALRQWPPHDPIDIQHEHSNLPPDHPHVKGEPRHVHPFTIDDLHPSWPTSG